MQRTTALYEGISDESVDMNSLMRVEFWLTNKVNNIVYRMLVLNTGQIPWNVKRQLEVVFEPLINSLEKEVQDIMLIRVDETSKRNKAGVYQANQFVELYLNFGTRKENLDIEDALTEEFAKLDLIQVTANKDFTDMFIKIAEFFVKTDSIFSKYSGTLQDDSNSKFKNGKDIFTSQPARVGFFVACARAILGIPGIDKTIEEQKKCADDLFEDFNNFINKLELKTEEEIGAFLCLNLIDEVITHKKSGKVGEYERTVFLKAFERLIDMKFDVETMNPCWRAYV